MVCSGVQSWARTSDIVGPWGHKIMGSVPGRRYLVITFSGAGKAVIRACVWVIWVERRSGHVNGVEWAGGLAFVVLRLDIGNGSHKGNC